MDKDCPDCNLVRATGDWMGCREHHPPSLTHCLTLLEMAKAGLRTHPPHAFMDMELAERIAAEAYAKDDSEEQGIKWFCEELSRLRALRPQPNAPLDQPHDSPNHGEDDGHS